MLVILQQSTEHMLCALIKRKRIDVFTKESHCFPSSKHSLTVSKCAEAGKPEASGSQKLAKQEDSVSNIQQFNRQFLPNPIFVLRVTFQREFQQSSSRELVASSNSTTADTFLCETFSQNHKRLNMFKNMYILAIQFPKNKRYQLTIWKFLFKPKLLFFVYYLL